MKKTIMLIKVILLIILNHKANSQTNTNLRLKPGDKVPDITLLNLMNYHSSTVKISDFKGKLLILDFWATWCKGCIEGFDKMEAYQKQFGDKIQILLINPKTAKDTEATIKTAFDKREKKLGKKVILPYVKMEPLLEQYFNWNSLPRYMWIDLDGKVMAITGINEMTDKNIDLALKGEGSKIQSRIDVAGYDRDKPMFINGNIGPQNEIPLYRSMFTKMMNGLNHESGSRFRELDGGHRLYNFINIPLIVFYSMNFKVRISELFQNQIIYKVKDTTIKKLFHNDYRVCYELIAPKGKTKEELESYARQDAIRTFGVKMVKDVKKLNVLILNPNSNLIKIKTKVINKDDYIFQFDRPYKNRYIKNGSVQMLIAGLSNLCPVPIINETGNEDKIDVYLPDDVNTTDLIQMKKWLESLGFSVSKEEREMDVVAITD